MCLSLFVLVWLSFYRFVHTMQTVHENRIYSLKIVCGERYPDQPPSVQFVSRVNLPFVNQLDGRVEPAKLPVLARWDRNSSIETVLVEIRRCVCSVFSVALPGPLTVCLAIREMAAFNNRKLPQPPEGSTF